ncbi:TPA: hypothetical protein EYO12_01260 [Candidatus Saccharibacteria bacterium]|nr:hypothetical protein [Candidatus Saccharibacteria bacterium]HIO87347.1 hypothetical protein [Candidatus Saccharibacteria bacterium]
MEAYEREFMEAPTYSELGTRRIPPPCVGSVVDQLTTEPKDGEIDEMGIEAFEQAIVSETDRSLTFECAAGNCALVGVLNKEPDGGKSVAYTGACDRNIDFNK